MLQITGPAQSNRFTPKKTESYRYSSRATAFSAKTPLPFGRILACSFSTVSNDYNKKKPAGNNEQDSGESSTGTSTNGSDTASSTNLETLLDQLAGVFGNGGASGNASTPDEPETNTPTPVAPEPTSENCIGADEFICAIEVAITFYTNKIRPANNPLLHHAHLSFVSRDWSDKPGSIRINQPPRISR